jgi:hypothetical protein
MDLKQMPDEVLRACAKKATHDERKALVNLLCFWREIERRRLFSAWKYTSLMDYATKELKYTEDAALRRMYAMRLMREMPEISSKIGTGELALTNLALAKSLFKRKPHSLAEKREVLRKIENKSVRAAKKVVYAICPEMKPNEKELDINSFEDEMLREKLRRVKGKYAHINPNMTLAELLHKMCDNELVIKAPCSPRVDSAAEVAREVRRKYDDKCSNCESTWAVEIDHIVPKAVGGPFTLENLRLLCRSCNQRAAIEYFGDKKMSNHLKDRVRPYLIAPLAQTFLESTS